MAGDQCTDRQSHQKLPYNGPGNQIVQLPSIDELEAMGGAEAVRPLRAAEVPASGRGLLNSITNISTIITKP